MFFDFRADRVTPTVAWSSPCDKVRSRFRAEPSLFSGSFSSALEALFGAEQPDADAWERASSGACDPLQDASVVAVTDKEGTESSCDTTALLVLLW